MDNTTQSDANQQEKTRTTIRSARVTRNTDGEPLGAGIFIEADELTALGIDPADAERLNYWIEDGRLQFAPTGHEVGGE